MAGTSGIFDVMTIRPPVIAPETACEVAAALWGLRALEARPLRGERDANFRLRAADGRQFVLKFANPAEEARFRDMQLGALRHIERRAPELPVPRVVPLPDGAPEGCFTDAAGNAHQVRLLSWIDGLPVGLSTRSAAQRIGAGEMLARLQAAMAGFTHEAANVPIVWDLAHFLALREVAGVLPDPLRELLLPIIDEFEARVTPIQGQLRRQVVHNDLNLANLLVDAGDHAKISGVIDFGDMAETPIVFDVAIAAYCQHGDDMPLAESAALVLRRYNELSPLREEEIALLPLLLPARAAMSASLACYHRHAQPGNDHYSMTAEQLQRRVAIITELRSPAAAQTVLASVA